MPGRRDASAVQARDGGDGSRHGFRTTAGFCHYILLLEILEYVYLLCRHPGHVSRDGGSSMAGHRRLRHAARLVTF